MLVSCWGELRSAINTRPMDGRSHNLMGARELGFLAIVLPKDLPDALQQLLIRLLRIRFCGKLRSRSPLKRKIDRERTKAFHKCVAHSTYG